MLYLSNYDTYHRNNNTCICSITVTSVKVVKCPFVFVSHIDFKYLKVIKLIVYDFPLHTSFILLHIFQHITIICMYIYIIIVMII